MKKNKSIFIASSIFLAALILLGVSNYVKAESVFEITHVGIDRVDASGNATEVYRSFDLHFSHKVKDFKISLYESPKYISFLEIPISGGMSEYYVKPDNWGKELKLNRDYKYVVYAISMETGETVIERGSFNTCPNDICHKPDLIIEDISYEINERMDNGFNKTFIDYTISYKNQGEGDVTDPFYIGFDCGGTVHDDLGNTHEITQTIEAGKTYYLQSSNDIRPTTNYNTRCAVYADKYLPFGRSSDYLSNKIHESNEDNNVYTEMISIKLKTPDIWVKEASLDEKWNYLNIKYCNGDFGYTMQPGGAYAWPDGFLMKVTINNIVDDNSDTDIDYKTPYELFSDNNWKHVFYVPADGYCGEGKYYLENFNTDTKSIQSAIIELDWDNNIQETPSGEKNNIKTFYFNGEEAVAQEPTPTPTPESEQTSNCIVSWSCENWSVCLNGTQTRFCVDANNCGNTDLRPALSQNCQIKKEVKPIAKTDEYIPQEETNDNQNNNSTPKTGTTDTALANRLKGKILLQVESHGEAWYIPPKEITRYYLKDGATAYEALRKFGLGITNADLEKIPVGLEDRFEDIDTDGDGLADKLEEGLKTDPNKYDTDGDGFSDGDEILGGFNPLGIGNQLVDNSLSERLKGSILLQVESKGEAWYVNPADGKRYYMKDGCAAYQIMRFLSLGITNVDLDKIGTGKL